MTTRRQFMDAIPAAGPALASRGLSGPPRAEVRAVLGMPDIAARLAAPVEAGPDVLRYPVDPRAADDKGAAFALTVSSDLRICLPRLRNGVVVVSPDPPASASDATVTRRELAEFVPGPRAPGQGNAAISDFLVVLGRNPFLPSAELGEAFDDPPEQRASSSTVNTEVQREF